MLRACPAAPPSREDERLPLSLLHVKDSHGFDPIRRNNISGALVVKILGLHLERMSGEITEMGHGYTIDVNEIQQAGFLVRRVTNEAR
jgi:hypothetical protein